MLTYSVDPVVYSANLNNALGDDDCACSSGPYLSDEDPDLVSLPGWRPSESLYRIPLDAEHEVIANPFGPVA